MVGGGAEPAAGASVTEGDADAARGVEDSPELERSWGGGVQGSAVAAEVLPAAGQGPPSTLCFLWAQSSKHLGDQLINFSQQGGRYPYSSWLFQFPGEEMGTSALDAQPLL